jgi:hypothetical protein
MNEWAVAIDIKQDNGYGQVDIEEDLATPMQQMQKWVYKVGMDRLKHLRDFTVSIYTCYKPGRCGSFDFRATVDYEHGFQIDLPRITCPYMELHTLEMSQHIATTELKRKKNGWKGESIIDFFLGNKKFWSEWFFTFPGSYEEYMGHDSAAPYNSKASAIDDDGPDGGVAIEDYDGNSKVERVAGTERWKSEVGSVMGAV